MAVTVKTHRHVSSHKEMQRPMNYINILAFGGQAHYFGLYVVTGQ